jgi:hypothetical protein
MLSSRNLLMPLRWSYSGTNDASPRPDVPTAVVLEWLPSTFPLLTCRISIGLSFRTARAWHAVRAPGPLHAFHARVAARRGGNIATVAVARKLAVIVWHMLSRGEDYAFARPSLTREKLRRLELMTGAEHQKGKRIGVFATKEQHDLDKQLAAQAELAYRRLAQDWQPAIKGTGAAPGRASRRPSSGQAARQETAPPPAL